MGIHYFHCTDGADLVVDQQGQAARDLDDVYGRAAMVAQSLMGRLPDYGDWWGWNIHIYDEVGEIDIVPFPVPLRRAA
jgi:hypothetical protein